MNKRGEWKITRNTGGIFEIYRCIDRYEADHAANREYFPGVFSDMKKAQRQADKLNDGTFKWIYSKTEIMRSTGTKS